MPRLNLTVGQVQPERKVANKKKEGEFYRVLDFMATGPGGAIDKYGIFQKTELFPLIKVGATIDTEVEDRTRQDNQGNSITDHNVLNIYVNGEPVIKQQVKGGGFQRPDNSPSIEAQTAIKEIGECWRAGKLKDDDPLVSVYRAWILGRLSPPAIPSSTSAASKPASPKATPTSNPLPEVTVASVFSAINKLLEGENDKVKVLIPLFAETGAAGDGVKAKLGSLSQENLLKVSARVNTSLQAKNIGAEPVEEDNIPF